MMNTLAFEQTKSNKELAQRVNMLENVQWVMIQDMYIKEPNNTQEKDEEDLSTMIVEVIGPKLANVVDLLF